MPVWVIAQKNKLYKGWDGRLYLFASEKEAQDFIDGNFKFFSKKFTPLKLRLQSSDYIELREKKFKNFAVDKF